MASKLYDNKTNNIKLISIVFAPLLIFLLGELVFNTGFKLTNIRILKTYLTIIVLSLFLYLIISFSNSPKRKIFDLIDKIGHNKNEDLNDKQIKEAQNELKKEIKHIVSLHLAYFFKVLFLSILNGYLTGHKIRSVFIFFILGVIILCNLSYIYERLMVYKYSGSKKYKITFKDYFIRGVNLNYKNPNYNIVENFNNDEDKPYKKASIKGILSGLVFGVVFGFIDNAGLISGLDALDKPFSKVSKLATSGIKSGGAKDIELNKERMESITAGLGNLFSDGLGVTIGAFLGKFAGSLFPSSVEQPIWIDMVGISLGCILGILIPISCKNITTGALKNMFKNNKIRFARNVFILLFTLSVIISMIIVLPKQAGDQLSKEIRFEENLPLTINPEN